MMELVTKNLIYRPCVMEVFYALLHTFQMTKEILINHLKEALRGIKFDHNRDTKNFVCN